MTVKHINKIPWSQIDFSGAERFMKEQKDKAKREEEIKNWKPYQDFSARKERGKDHTKVFKDIYNKVKDDLHSNDEKRKGLAQLKLHELLAVYSDRPLTAHELKNIIVHCEIKNPRMRINAFGQLYCTKEINSFMDIDHK